MKLAPIRLDFVAHLYHPLIIRARYSNCSIWAAKHQNEKMALLEKHLVVKDSGIPNSGKGLFTQVDIPKGTRIVEYKGRITTWKEADIDEGRNAYLFRVKSYHTIDARPTLKNLARYANDAKGFQKIKGLRNNCVYVIDGLQVFIESVKPIAAGEEIFVDYGKEYWDVMKRNKKIDELAAKKEAAKKRK